MVCAKLIALMLWGVAVLGVLSSPVKAQTPKQVPPIKNLCLARRSASSCRSANQVGNFDGSGQTDYAVWRPSIGTWFVLSSSDPSKFFVQAWGESGDVPVPGDYDGDGITDYAVWRPSTGTWFIIPSSNPSQPIIQQWGASGDIPVPGDYDGDGTTDIAVWRPSNGIWYVIPSSNPTTYIVQQWGTNGDIPVPGVYDDGGQTDYAVWRPSNGTWFVLSSFNPSEFIEQQWGEAGDTPVVGDFDGDGITDFAIWRNPGGTWFIIPSSTPSQPIVQQWGTTGDIPVPGDYDGDGTTDIAVWRPSGGVWWVIPSSAPTTFLATQWGLPGDLPVVDTAPAIAGANQANIPAMSSRSASTREVGSNPAAALAAVHCPAQEEQQCATPPDARVRPVSEAESVIGAQADRPVEQAVKRLGYLMPPDLQRQVGNAPSDAAIRLLSDAPRFMGVPPNVRPEEVGRTRILPLPPPGQIRP
jgi:hypothetical protein